MKISDLISRCHEASVNGGWYTNLETGLPLERNIGEMMVLIHSEVSEAYYAWINDDMDDKLPHRLGVEVELADTLIRVFDLAGYLSMTLDQHKSPYLPGFSGKMNTNEKFNIIHYIVSSSYENYRKSDALGMENELTAVVSVIYEMADDLNLNIDHAIEEKLIFNANRADHKIENRKKPGGKRT